jgi:5-methyltetrahydropteroyltriglutamate--homocysteine methyltransferase
MVDSAIVGMPRIGRARELKAATEGYWSGRVSADELRQAARGLRVEQWTSLSGKGIDSIPSNTFSFYDQMLDTAALFGAVPPRFDDRKSAHRTAGRCEEELNWYFSMARGGPNASPLALTKWFDTNYYYLVPELSPETRFTIAGDKPLGELAEAAALGIATTPVLIGPLTFLMLSRPAASAPGDFTALQLLEPLLAAYANLLGMLRCAGATWVQLDEPAFVADRSVDELAALRHAYRRLGELSDRPKINVCSYFGSLGPALPVLTGAPVEGIGLDLRRGHADLDQLRQQAPPALAGKTLFAGVVDARNIWINDLSASLQLLSELTHFAGNVAVSTSCSLQHVPIDVDLETGLDDELRSWLAFADQKVGEVATLARGLRLGASTIGTELAANRYALETQRRSLRTCDATVRSRLAALPVPEEAHRAHSMVNRRTAQATRLGLPLLPTTTIGSFPQTTALRRARAARRRGDLPEHVYQDTIRAEIARVITVQEQAGLDVLVHGEPERKDMVGYFADALTGFATTDHGWVQSYGTRYVRPPILFGDVARPTPITVGWTTYAQSLTERPVKGMLTGPVTMLSWSFVRDDQPLVETCTQLAVAVGAEVADLQAAGVAIIQVDEPGLLELLPLRRAERAAYLAWATGCFRLALMTARPDTQIHTHMCYADFDDIVTALSQLDADVVSLEAARSGMTLPSRLAEGGYTAQVGPGVYDVHSPRVPTSEDILNALRQALAALDVEQLWVNPDCGLKTRDYSQVVPALRNLVHAAQQARAHAAADGRG